MFLIFLLYLTHSRTHPRILICYDFSIITPLGSRSAPMSAASTPFEYARERLHVSAVPGTLPCRDEEFAEIYSTVENAVTSNKGCCLYISGVPGTGKTATVQEVIRTLVAYKDQDVRFIPPSILSQLRVLIYVDIENPQFQVCRT